MTIKFSLRKLQDVFCPATVWTSYWRIGSTSVAIDRHFLFCVLLLVLPLPKYNGHVTGEEFLNFAGTIFSTFTSHQHSSVKAERMGRSMREKFHPVGFIISSCETSHFGALQTKNNPRRIARASPFCSARYNRFDRRCLEKHSHELHHQAA